MNRLLLLKGLHMSARLFAFLSFVLSGILFMHAGIVESRHERIVPGAPFNGLKLDNKLPESEIMRKKVVPAARYDEEPKVGLRVEFPAVGRTWSMMPNRFYVYNESGYYQTIEVPFYDDNGEELHPDHLDIELPSGTYDFLGHFQKINPGYYGGYEKTVYNIIENVEVSDGCVVRFNPEECTVRLKMETYNPDGEKTRFSRMRLFEDWTAELVEDGNVTSNIGYKIILFNNNSVYNESNFISGVVSTPDSPLEFDCQKEFDFYVNPVSDRYSFRNISIFGAWPDFSKGYYVMVCECKGAHEGTYTNSREFIYDDSCVVPTPAFVNIPVITLDEGIEFPYKVSFDFYMDDIGDGLGSIYPFLSTSTAAPTNETWRIYSACPENPINPEALYFKYNKTLNDSYKKEIYDWGELTFVYGTCGPDIFPFAKGGETMNVSPYTPQGFPGMWNPQASDYPYRSFPGNRPFMAMTSELDLSPGESVPMFSFLKTLYRPFIDKPEIYDDFECWYTGRLDETIGSNIALSKMQLFVDGAIVAEGINDMRSWMLENPSKGSEFRIETSALNFEIDGIEGGNKSIVIYDDSKDDSVPPSATMLQFRNKENKVCQEFAESEEALVILTAADFDIHMFENEYGGSSFWVESSVPAKVTATVKPTGVETEAFEEIDLTENPEAFDPRGFGALYTGSLAGISMTSPTGWFDLTIAVEDAAGNSQVQTLSPCFKINALASVGELGTEDHTVRVSGRDIIAPEGSRVYTVSGLPSGMTDLTPGLYLVVTPSGTRKVAIR